VFIDSHCHLQSFDFSTLGMDEAALMLEAKQHNVEYFLCAGIHLNEYKQLQTIANKYVNVSISIGLHPTETIEIEPKVQDYLPLLQDPKVVAVGETGLDYYRLQEDFNRQQRIQQQRFRIQIQAALASNKPLIVHTRDAKEDTLCILKEEQADKVGGVFHCFTGDIPFAKQALDLNFSISLSGMVTFNKADDIKAVAKWVPLDKLLIETDAPFLAPVPFRGKINKPAYVKYIAEYIAKLRGMPIEELADKIQENYFRIFKCNVK
jgi:TatD DNase family protein